MDIPLEIAFHNMAPPLSIEGAIRDHVAKLERRYSHLVGCRVAVEALHKPRRTYEVHIELRVPGREIVVNREPHHGPERHASPRLRTALREAFKAAASCLTEFKAVQRGFVKAHETPASDGVEDRDDGFVPTSEDVEKEEEKQ